MRVGGREVGNQLLQAQHAAPLGAPHPAGLGPLSRLFLLLCLKDGLQFDGALGRRALSLSRLGWQRHTRLGERAPLKTAGTRTLLHSLTRTIPNSGVCPTVNPLTSSKASWTVPFMECLWPQPRLFSTDQQGRPSG